MENWWSKMARFHQETKKEEAIWRSVTEGSGQRDRQDRVNCWQWLLARRGDQQMMVRYHSCQCWYLLFWQTACRWQLPVLCHITLYFKCFDPSPTLYCNTRQWKSIQDTMNVMMHSSYTNLDVSSHNLQFVWLRLARRCASKSDKINHLVWVERDAWLACHRLVVNLRCLWRWVIVNFTAQTYNNHQLH